VLDRRLRNWTSPVQGSGVDAHVRLATVIGEPPPEPARANRGDP
jgi:hypothetical protein